MDEYKILEELKNYIADTINTELEAIKDQTLTYTQITDKEIVLDYPDVDNGFKADTTIFITPEEVNYENLSAYSNLANVNATVYIMLKKDKRENLIKKCFDYFSAFYTAIYKDTSLNSNVDNTEITNMIFYPAVEANTSIVCIEIKLTIIYTKEI